MQCFLQHYTEVNFTAQVYFEISQHCTSAFYFWNALLQCISQHGSTAVYYKPTVFNTVLHIGQCYSDILQCYTAMYYKPVTVLWCYTLDSVTVLHCVFLQTCSTQVFLQRFAALKIVLWSLLHCAEPIISSFQSEQSVCKKKLTLFFAKPNCAKKDYTASFAEQ